MKKQFRSIYIFSFALFLLLTACGQAESKVETTVPAETLAPTSAPETDPPVTESPATEPPATEPPTTEPPETEAPLPEGAELLSQEEIDALTELFYQSTRNEDGTIPLTNWYNMAMFDSYETPQQTNLKDLFSMGVGGDYNKFEPTEAETAFLETQTHIEKWGSTYRIPRETMNEVLQQYFGLTLAETDGVGLDEMAYFPETDCYYWSISDVRYTLDFEITVAYRTAEGNVVFYYSVPFREYMMTIKPVEGGYHIHSNIWLDDWTKEIPN